MSHASNWTSCEGTCNTGSYKSDFLILVNGQLTNRSTHDSQALLACDPFSKKSTGPLELTAYQMLGIVCTTWVSSNDDLELSPNSLCAMPWAQILPFASPYYALPALTQVDVSRYGAKEVWFRKQCPDRCSLADADQCLSCIQYRNLPPIACGS